MVELRKIQLDQIIPDPEQPRKEFDEIELVELSNSIRAVGLIQPIKVRLNPDQNVQAKYMIVAGERRFKAVSLLGDNEIDAVVEMAQMTQDELYAQQLTENLHRKDLNPVEKAEFIQARIDYLKGQGVESPVEKVSQELGVSKSWISKSTAILKYDEDIRSLARVGLIKDYAAIKKLSNLRGEKRQSAIELINKGKFNSKKFFSRKSPEINKEFQEDDAVIVNTKTKVFLSAESLLLILERSDFISILDREDLDWRDKVKSNQGYLKKVLNLYLEYCKEADNQS